MIKIGISGWTYPPWRGPFYPKGLPQKRELEYASRQVLSIEINGTFYSLQRPASFAAWAAAVPDDFIFSVKAPRYITHIRRLRDPEPMLANFFASGLLRLGARLGPILWQLPPNFQFDAERLAAFLAALPHTTQAAAELARHHEARLDNRDWTEATSEGPVRHAIEIRHESFRTPAFTDLLRTHKVALVCADTVEWPRLADTTADFVYCRLHGSEQLYASGYDDAALDAWAARVKLWSAGGVPADLDHIGARPPHHKRDVFVYFDNDLKVRAPADARALMHRLDLHPGASFAL